MKKEWKNIPTNGILTDFSNFFHPNIQCSVEILKKFKNFDTLKKNLKPPKVLWANAKIFCIPQTIKYEKCKLRKFFM